MCVRLDARRSKARTSRGTTARADAGRTGRTGPKPRRRHGPQHGRTRRPGGVPAAHEGRMQRETSRAGACRWSMPQAATGGDNAGAAICPRPASCLPALIGCRRAEGEETVSTNHAALLFKANPRGVPRDACSNGIRCRNRMLAKARRSGVFSTCNENCSDRPRCKRRPCRCGVAEPGLHSGRVRGSRGWRTE